MKNVLCHCVRKWRVLANPVTNEAFLTRYKKSCKNLARKNCKIIFLQDLIKILQENYLANFSCKVLARFFISYKKSFIFSAKLARFSARSCNSCKKNTCKIWIFLARRFLPSKDLIAMHTILFMLKTALFFSFLVV